MTSLALSHCNVSSQATGKRIPYTPLPAPCLSSSMGKTAWNWSNRTQLMALWETITGTSSSGVTSPSLNCNFCNFYVFYGSVTDLFLFYLPDDLEIQYIVSNSTLPYFIFFQDFLWIPYFRQESWCALNNLAKLLNPASGSINTRSILLHLILVGAIEYAYFLKTVIISKTEIISCFWYDVSYLTSGFHNESWGKGISLSTRLNTIPWRANLIKQ